MSYSLYVCSTDETFQGGGGGGGATLSPVDQTAYHLFGRCWIFHETIRMRKYQCRCMNFLICLF